MRVALATGFYNHPAYHSQVANWQATGRIHHEAVDNFESLFHNLNQSKYDLVFLGLDHAPLSPLLEVIVREYSNLESLPILVALTQQYSCCIRSDLLLSGADWVLELNDDQLVVSARIDAVLRRCRKSYESQVFDFPPYRLNKGSMEIQYNGHTKYLSKLEFRLLEYLFIHRDVPHSRDLLMHKVWGRPYYESDRRVDTKMSHLRTRLNLDGSFGWKLEADRKERGYRLNRVVI